MFTDMIKCVLNSMKIKRLLNWSNNTTKIIKIICDIMLYINILY